MAYYSCRYQPPRGSMCLAPTSGGPKATGDAGKFCAAHLGQAKRDHAAFMSKPLVPVPALPLAEDVESAQAAAARRSRWPFWPGAEEKAEYRGVDYRVEHLTVVRA